MEMEFDFEMLELEMVEELDKVLNRLHSNLAKVRTGRADPSILDNLKFDYYGDLTDLSTMAQVTLPESRQLLIKPYDRGAIPGMMKALRQADLGIEPSDEGERIRMTFPTLTTETRRIMAKNIGKFSEESKIGVRKVRQDFMKQVERSGLSDDMIQQTKDDVQEYIVSYNKKVETICKEKEEQVMTI